MSTPHETDPSGRDAHAPGAKLDQGKLLAWLFMSGFPRALECVADVTTKGARKYTPNGWASVPDGVQRYMEAFGRHQFDLAKGLVFDNGPGGTGCRHKAQMIWNLLASLELELRAEEANKNNRRFDPIPVETIPKMHPWEKPVPAQNQKILEAAGLLPKS